MDEKETILAPPRGMRDFYPDDMFLRNAIFDAWRLAASRYGFLQYDACVVESLNLLKRKSGEEITDQIYTFVDKSGRELALRPEMTPSLARMVAAKQASLSFPLRWFAIAQCFRYERMTKGRRREHYQWNLDIIGDESVSAELEVIACAAHALDILGLGVKDVTIHFSSRTLLADLLAQLGVPPEQHALAFLALDKRGKIEDADIRKLLADGGIEPAGADRILGLVNISSFAQVCEMIPPENSARRRMEQFMDLLPSYGLDKMVQFDISVVRGLSYYTGIVFEAFDANKKSRAIFGGGRYDNLLGDIGGTPATAVGLGFGDVVIADVLSETGKAPAANRGGCMTIGYMTEDQRKPATVLATALRRKGKPVDVALRPEKAKHFFSRAGNMHFSEAVYLGPDDIAKGTIRIKDLASRQESELPISQVTQD